MRADREFLWILSHCVVEKQVLNVRIKIFDVQNLFNILEPTLVTAAVRPTPELPRPVVYCDLNINKTS